MEIYFNSMNLNHKKPFGALKTDSKVKLSIKISSGEKIVDCNINYEYGLKNFVSGKARMLPVKDDNDYYFTKIVMPDEPCLLFYWFEIVTNSDIIYYTRDASANNGTGVKSHARPVISANNTNHIFPFQITVYCKEFKTPDWYKGAVMYQIFPDRFFRGKDFDFDKMIKIKDYPERIYHKDWNEDVDFKGSQQTGYLACDFFGGSINGIREKLDYLENLGVDVIYLNPIFDSRSNHRYDTGNYEQVDPMLGSNTDFVNLCSEAGKRSIRIILDGVFSHTGADSVYFNKFGRYPGEGAYQDAKGYVKSPYFSWYDFNIRHGNISYDSWWGFLDLPNVNESDLMYRDYILGEKGITGKWINYGSSGWRIDVSDEIPDSFLRKLRKSVKVKNKDAVIIGEVWEDASNKISFGGFRDFLLGNTHDSVMGYPFCNAVISWMSGDIGVEKMVNILERIRENYPAESFYCNMNLISSHDIPRAITALAGKRNVNERSEQAVTHLSGEERAKGLKLLKLAMLFQMTTPGSPSVYYGDEIAMEGYRDPFNRRTFNWDETSERSIELLEWLSALINFRRNNCVLKTGFINYEQYKDNILVFKRFLENSKDAFGKIIPENREIRIIINRNEYPVEIKSPEYTGNFAAISAAIIINGKRVFET